MELAKYKAVLCEGSAEEAITDILLDNHCLLFEREELIEEEVLRIRSARNFETRYLRKGYNGKISVIRILDSRSERFNLSPEYQDKVDVINIVTAPEIEMLIIISEHEYDRYKRSGKSPSDYCKENPQISKGDLFELMIKAYITLQEINKQIIDINIFIKENNNDIKEAKDILNEILGYFIKMKNIDH